MDEDDVENDPEEENLEQSSNYLKTASKRASIAEQLKVCNLIFVLCENDVATLLSPQQQIFTIEISYVTFHLKVSD